MPPSAKSAADDLSAKAYRSLRQMIVEGHVHPRQRLSHRALSKDLGIGRSPVRDALLQLEAEGLIEHRPNSGIFLRELTPRELECIYELRIVNEPYAAEKAADRAEASHLARLRKLCEEMDAMAQQRDPVAWFGEVEHRRRFCKNDMDFHITVMEASGNPIAAKFFGNAQVLAFTFAWDLGHGRPEWFGGIVGRVAADHRVIYEAIRLRDAQAARAKMEAHVLWARADVLEQFAGIVESRG